MSECVAKILNWINLFKQVATVDNLNDECWNVIRVSERDAFWLKIPRWQPFLDKEWSPKWLSPTGGFQSSTRRFWLRKCYRTDSLAPSSGWEVVLLICARKCGYPWRHGRIRNRPLCTPDPPWSARYGLPDHGEWSVIITKLSWVSSVE